MNGHYWHATMSFPDGRIGSICIEAFGYGDAVMKLRMLFPDGNFVYPDIDPSDKGAIERKVKKTE